MNTRNMTLSVIGLGYVGLPLALLFLEKGYRVIGIDRDSRKIEMLKRGESYLPDLTDETVRSALDRDFVIAADYDALAGADAVVLCVPTPLDERHEPDLSYLMQAARQLKDRLRSGQLVVLESSTYPGTTREVLLPALEESGLSVGKDFYLGYSPERVDPGNRTHSLQNIPKIVSGVTGHCLEKVRELYGSVFADVIAVSTTEAAELTKLLENAYRFVNISFINELAMICDELKVDVWEIIDAAKTKPFGFSAFYPGPGIGGHCIPVDPIYLQWAVRQRGMDTGFIGLSRFVNHRMPAYIVEQIQARLSPLKPMSDSSILVYGVAYKRNTNDVRDSGALEILKLLKKTGADVRYHDPYVPSIRIGEERMESVPLTDESLKAADCVVVLTDHSCIPAARIMECASLIYDTRNVFGESAGKAAIFRLGGGR